MTLSTTELTDLRTFVTDIMLNTCSIKRRTSTNDGYGGVTTTWATLASNIACRYSFGAPSASGQVAGRIVEQEASSWRVTVPYGTDVTALDRILLDNGQELEVLGVSVPQTFSTSVVCNCAPVIA